MYNNNDIKRQILNFKEIIKKGKKVKGRYFLGKTFSAKLFIKLCSKVVDISIIALEILNFEKENRTKEDIETVLPWMKNLYYFYEFISIKETEESKKEILRQFIWLLYRKIFNKNSIITKIDNINNFSCIILEGYLIKIDLVIYREVLSLEEYLIYLIKMEIMNEKEIINKCKILNKSFVDINTNSIKEFCDKSGDLYNYFSLKDQAMKELIECGIIFEKKPKKKKIIESQDYKIESIDNYLNIFIFKTNAKASHDIAKAYYSFYLGKYTKNGIMKKGQYIGSFLREEMKDNSKYIAKEKCVVAVFNKERDYTDKLYKAYIEKMIRIFKEIKNKFVMFHSIQTDIFYYKYVPHLNYRKYFKGEKIFLQNSLYGGIYLLTNGTIKLSINISIDEMKNLMTYLTYSLNNFKDYISSFNNEKYTQNNIKSCIDNIPKDLNDLFYKRDEYDLGTIKEYNIIGSNETYNPKTQIYNFNCECISDSAVLYFFPQFYLHNLLNKEKEVYNSYIHLVEFRIKDIIWKMKKHIAIFEREIKHKKFNINKTINNFFEKEKFKNRIISRNEKNILNENIFLTKNNINNNIQTLYNNHPLYNTKTNFKSEIRIKNIKKIFIENEKNREINNTDKNNKNNFRKKHNLNIPLIFTNKRKEKEHNISKSQDKQNKIKNMPDIFPFIIIDTKTKDETFKNRYNNNIGIENHIKTISNLSTLKLKKKLFINSNQL